MAWALALAALLFLYRMVQPDIPEIRRSLSETHWISILLALLIAMAMYLTQAMYHVGVLAAMRNGPIRLQPAMGIYLQSQIVRYLPGRIWGMVYQSGRMAADYRPSEIVIANFWQMLMTNLVAVGIIFSALLAHRFSPLWLLLIVLVLCMAEWLHRKPGLATWMLGKLRRNAASEEVAQTHLRPIKWRATILLVVEWVLYLLVFLVLLHSKVDVLQALSLGAWYAGATLLALIAFVVPGGFAVREAIFVGVPAISGIEPAVLTVTAALLRGVLLLAELVVAAMAGFLPGSGNDVP